MSEAVPVLLGEIHTGLLQSSTAVTPDVAGELLALIPRTPVRAWERPIRHVVSPERLTGVDGKLPSESGTQTRAVGTVATEARITGGHILQACSRAAVVATESNERRRLPWSHYLSRPGTLEAWGSPGLDDLVDGFLRVDPLPGILDLGGSSAYLMGEIQGSDLLDRSPSFRVSRTRLRWAVMPASASGEVLEAREAAEPAALTEVSFLLEAPALRTLRITGGSPALLEQIPELCQDIALHDWLLTTVVSIVDVAHIGGRDRDAVLDHLHPVMDHLLHAWMPAARLPDELRALWDEIDRRAGLERQWETLVRRIRDQVALASILPGPNGGGRRRSPDA